MAESQVLFPYDEPSLVAIRAAISDPRFDTYMVAAGQNPTFAVGLYLYNARLSKALLFPLHVVEVTLRNAIDELLCHLYGPHWPSDPGMRAILTAGSLQALDTGIERAEREKGPNPPRGQIVATLTFDFWSNLFRSEYDRTLWQVHLRATLPNLPPGLTRPDVQSSAKAINRLRNRIAHHEPIIGRDVTGLHKTIVDLVAARNAGAAKWLRHFSTLSSAIRSKPTPQNSLRPTVGEICDPGFGVAKGTDKLTDALAAYTPTVPALVRVNDLGEPTAALPPSYLLHYLVDAAHAAGGLVDLGEHDIDAVIAKEGLGSAWAGMDANEPFPKAVAALQAQGVRAVLVTDEQGGVAAVKGVIVRAHRRY
jgi:hypothetical protein